MSKFIIVLSFLLTSRFLFAQVMLTTKEVSSIFITKAMSGGNISNDGGAKVIFRGVCWSKSPNPTVSLATKTLDGIGSGEFKSFLTRLEPNTTYYLRAYATTSLGTFYGKQEFFTSGIAEVLPSVTIGAQVWTTQNLSVANYLNGDIIPKVTDSAQWRALTTGAWCWYNNDSATYAATYGRLYNWYAVNDARGLAPQGWHIPSDAEWNRLIKYLDKNADTTCSQCFQSSISGGAMKSVTGWDAPNKGATNISGFTGLPGGYRGLEFYWVNSDGMWWSSTNYGYDFDQSAYYRGLRFDSCDVWRGETSRCWGFSVRCVKD